MSLKLENISKGFGRKPLLNEVFLEIDNNEIVGLFGRNGTGKSTLLKIIFGLLKPDSGIILMDGKDFPCRKNIPSGKIAFLPQDSFLPKNRKVREIIPLFFPNGNDQDQVFYAKGVADFCHKKIGDLSLGQLRYLEVLLIGNLQHPYLLLDEPFSMIEPVYKEYIQNFILTLKNSKGILLTDHYYLDVLKVSNRNLLLKDQGLLPIQNENDLITNRYLTKN